MKRFLALILTAILCIFLIACDKTKDNDEKLTIVTTAFPHYDFVRQITDGNDNIEITMLIPPASEVHTYDPTPGDILKISTCDIFVYTGGESDGWAKQILSSSSNSDMQIISFTDICDAVGDCESEKEHEDGHEHEYDEHVWTNPVYTKAIAEHIYSAVSVLDEQHGDLYKENLDTFICELEKLDKALIQLKEDAVRDTIIVGDRFPFYHLAHQYGIEYKAAYSGCSSVTEPSAATIAALSDLVKKENIPYVFTIEFSNGKIADSITEETAAKTLLLHSCHNVTQEEFEDGITYLNLMTQNIENLRLALCS